MKKDTLQKKVIDLEALVRKEKDKAQVLRKEVNDIKDAMVTLITNQNALKIGHDQLNFNDSIQMKVWLDKILGETSSPEDRLKKLDEIFSSFNITLDVVEFLMELGKLGDNVVKVDFSKKPANREASR